MRLLILALSFMGLVGLAACENQREPVEDIGTEDVGETGTQEEGLMEEDVAEEGLGEQEGERAPAGAEGLTQEQCDQLQEDGITDDEQEMFQRCQDAGFL